MDHDQLFKDLLTTFFTEFLELFFPEMAAELDRDSIQFLDKELHTDIGTGDQHEVDLLVKVRLSGREAFILIHVENQSTARSDFPKRMFHYFALLHKKHDLPVFPIAMFSYDRPLTPAADTYAIELFRVPILRFKFQSIQLNQLNWRDFVYRPNPVANALMTKMKFDPADRPRVRLECLRMMATLKLNPAKASLIGIFMRSYLGKLTPAEEIVYNEEAESVTNSEKAEMQNYDAILKELAREEGVFSGRAWGRIEIITRQLSRLFGPISPQLRTEIINLDVGALDDLADALLGFKSLDDANAWLAKSRSTP